MPSKEWLDNLKIGDSVYVDCGRFNKTGQIGHIVRLTKTQIIVKYFGTEYRFRKKDGYRVGDDAWHQVCIYQLTNKHLVEIRIAKLKSEAISLRGKLGIPNSEAKLRRFIDTLKSLIEDSPPTQGNGQ